MKICFYPSCRGARCVLLRVRFLLAAIVVSGFVLPARAALLIDGFTTPQSATVSGMRPRAFDSENAPEAIGGNRELRVTRTSHNQGAAQLDVGSSISPGAAFSLGFGSTGTASIVWDGLDNRRRLVPRGLGGLDLTQAGANDRFSLMGLADAGTEITIRVYSSWRDWSEATLQIPPSLGAFTEFQLPFDEFIARCGSSGVDFTSVGALSLTFAGRENLDVGIRYFAVVPEPATWFTGATLLTACVWLGMRRKAASPKA